MIKEKLFSPTTILLFTYGSGIALHLFIPCYFGNAIKINSIEFITDVYRTDWLSATKEERRNIFILMGTMRHPIRVRLAGTFDMDLNIFLSVINYAYSLFAIFKRLS